MELFVNDKSRGKQTVVATVRSVNDCLFLVDEDGETMSDYTWLFSAYVNENHPWLDGVLKEALDTGIVSSFDAYQSGKLKFKLHGEKLHGAWMLLRTSLANSTDKEQRQWLLFKERDDHAMPADEGDVRQSSMAKLSQCERTG